MTGKVELAHFELSSCIVEFVVLQNLGGIILYGTCRIYLLDKRVEYEQYFIYGRADRKVNNAITFEQSLFSEIHELKTFEVSC